MSDFIILNRVDSPPGLNFEDKMVEHFNVQESETICGHKDCQTSEAKWLCLDQIYQKLYRPNCYDIGGTYIKDMADFWFLYKTEIVGNIFLLHIFVTKRHTCSFSVSISCTNDLIFRKKQNIAFLPLAFKQFDFDSISTQAYLTTFSFAEVDVDVLKGKKLYIPIALNSTHKACSPVIEDMKNHHNYKFLLSNPVYSDFVIESADGAKFNVHKSLLCVHSEVFRAMLKDETAESQNSYVKMVDVNKEDLQDIIEYIYTGTIDDFRGCNFFNLLALCDQYDLQGLKELAESALIYQINVDSVIETLAIADLHNSDTVKLAAMKYIKLNKNRIQFDTLDDLNNVELVKEICQFIAI